MKAEDIYSEDQKTTILKFIRSVIECRLAGEKLPSLEEGIPNMDTLGSCFVTLHTATGALRGCIGNIAPTENLGANIRTNAINAAFRDPRFRPVNTKDELDSLKIEISILTPMEDINSVDEFEIGRHGILLILQGRSSVFLPQVAPEQGWDKPTTLQHLSMKAGFPPNAWQDPSARFRVFEAVVFSEPE